MKLIVDLKDRQYPIWIERKALYHIDEIINTHRKIAIIHDDAIPSKWIEIVKEQCENCVIFSFPEGENSKWLNGMERLDTPRQKRQNLEYGRNRLRNANILGT